MAISEELVVTGYCDLCRKEIDTSHTYVDAMCYGASFHVDCLKASSGFSPFQVIKALGLDDIYSQESDKLRVKLIYNFN